MISVSDVEKLITSKTKAIMVVDWAGSPANLSGFESLSRKYSIPVIQDAAHAFGAKFAGKSIAEFADFTCYSFQAIKHFTTGDGGALVCRRASDHVLARKLKWFGYDRDTVKDSKGEWKGQKWDADILPGEVGYKFNMNNMSAAVGLANLPKMHDVLESHKRNATQLSRMLSSHPKVKILDSYPGADSTYWVYTLRVHVGENRRDTIIANLNEKGVGAGLVHLPNDRYTAFNPFKRELAETELFASTQISLPCGWWLNSADIEVIAHALIDELNSQHD
jgi:dTDP-4-amino-4,6-dideoxygalactose transaminase